MLGQPGAGGDAAGADEASSPGAGAGGGMLGPVASIEVGSGASAPSSAAAASAAQDPSLESPAPVPGLAIVARLHAESASAAEWRRQALLCYGEGREADFRQVLEAALQGEYEVRAMSGPERGAMLHLLAVYYVGRASSASRLDRAEREADLARAKGLLDQVEDIDVSLGSMGGVDVFTGRGFHALATHMVSPGTGSELKRAEFLFDAALKLDPAAPHAVLGQAIVFTYHKEWAKALELFRQVLRRASPSASRSSMRLRCLQQLRFVMAVCFCGLERFEQTRNSLVGAVAADARDVESLCALAHLEAKISKDGIGKSMEYLDSAAEVDQEHPVTLCQLANHAFYCGLEEQSGSGGEPDSWQTARGLLEKALVSSRSPQVRAEAQYQRGRLAHARGEYSEAYEEYLRCRELQPDHHACAFGLAQVCVQQQRPEEAASVLEALRRQRGDLPEVLKLLTYAYLVSGKAKEAVQCADAIAAKSADDFEVQAMRAEAHDQLHASKPGDEAPKVGIEAYEKVATQDGTCCTPEMWNNLGTLRGLGGDLPGAREAYTHGLQLAEQRLAERKANGEEKKDLQIARLTMRFNRAWVSESLGDQPNFAQATQDYMVLGEEHNWFSDALLRLGAQWQRMGEADLAVQRYQEAMKQNPVLAALMQAEAFRHRGDYTRALQSAENAVRHAGTKQFHYAHVSLGNLYYEVATASKTKSKDRDQYLCKALRNFIQALGHEKDSHFAANGIGMVFAQRGKLDFARRTFQSVMQHRAMASDPSVYINLGHTYLRKGGDDARKAIALYERAKKLAPKELRIRLYIAKAYHGLGDFDRCAGVLGDALQIWPEDLLLRYNLAVAFEGNGFALVAKEKETKRVVGVDSGKDQMTRAVELLTSAARLYEHVHAEWSSMSQAERSELQGRSGVPRQLLIEMEQAHHHMAYCQYIAEDAQQHLGVLTRQREEMDLMVQKIEAEKEAKAKEVQAQKESESQQARGRDEEMEDQALLLMQTGSEIQLGRNLEQTWKDHMAGGKDKGKKDAKGKASRDAPIRADAVEAAFDQLRGEGEAGEEQHSLSLQDVDQDQGGTGRRGRRGKKDKKKDKKGKKKDKKHKKRGREEYDDAKEGEESGAEHAEPTERSNRDLFDDGPAEPILPTADANEPVEGDSDEVEDRKEKKHKKDKKGKKDKKDKKAKKEAKRARLDKEDQEAEQELFGGEDGGRDMEEELFGGASD